MVDARPQEIQDNLKRHVFFHAANSVQDVIDLSRTGFKHEWRDEDGRWFRGGNLGNGTYLTCNWRMAMWFGAVLLQVSLRRGTKIVDTSLPPDERVLAHLKREFGADILHGDDVRKVIPKNKRLTLEELVAVTRYHYRQVWHRDWGTTKELIGGREFEFLRCPPRKIRHQEALKSCTSVLKRYGYHGYGNPGDDNGIVIFASDRVVLERVLAQVPEGEHCGWGFDVPVGSLGELRTKYPVRFELPKR